LSNSSWRRSLSWRHRCWRLCYSFVGFWCGVCSVRSVGVGKKSEAEKRENVTRCGSLNVTSRHTVRECRKNANELQRSSGRRCNFGIVTQQESETVERKTKKKECVRENNNARRFFVLWMQRGIWYRSLGSTAASRVHICMNGWSRFLLLLFLLTIVCQLKSGRCLGAACRGALSQSLFL
jgi:hypothetical protein